AGGQSAAVLSKEAGVIEKEGITLQLVIGPLVDPPAEIIDGHALIGRRAWVAGQVGHAGDDLAVLHHQIDIVMTGRRTVLTAAPHSTDKNNSRANARNHSSGHNSPRS